MGVASNGDLYEYDFVIVGAGFYGLTLAHQLTTRSNAKVIVLDKREHLGGNAYSYTDADTNIEIHKYGSHLFHTSNDRVWEFINQFAEFNSYRHTVKTVHKNQIFSLPINLHTISQFNGHYLNPLEASNWIDLHKVEMGRAPANLEEQAISLIGKPLYDAFIKGYTAKQWQTDPVNLPPEIIKRLPVRFNFVDRYFDDKYEGLPVAGYGQLFTNMKDSANFEVRLGFDFDPNEYDISRFKKLVYTGPLDRFFSYKHGVLGWRTLDFIEERIPVIDYQGTSVVNYADEDVNFTRIHEFKHLHPERTQSDDLTIIFKEFSRFATQDDEPYYPINSKNDRDVLLKYREESLKFTNVMFGGRLGRYQYLDMHMAIASALQTSDEMVASTSILKPIKK